MRSGFRAWLSTCGPDLETPLKRKEDAVHRLPADVLEDPAPYLGPTSLAGSPKKVYLETYGCQMNVSDTETAWAILQRSGYQRTSNLAEADVVLLVTCSVREKAEQTVWNRLHVFKILKTKRQRSRGSLRIGILGCMAERLKEKILEEEKLVDIVAGPDAYRDLPRLLAVAESGQQAANVLLSLDETYADILPVHLNSGATTAFIYCIVPFTRGRERSRPLASILQEVQMLSDQNVNSYRDNSEVQFHSLASPELRKGFRTVYKAKKGGLRFAELLDRVAAVDPEMRIRFTSPHPKDFPDEVFEVMRERHNICKQVHLPAQSGSSRVLEAMKRGKKIPPLLFADATLTSDFIAGFCGETEADHLQTLSLLREVGYNFAYIFAYSQRQKTRAFHRLPDDVPPDVKHRRLEELNVVFREEASRLHAAAVGQRHVVLVEGVSVPWR
ncbi:putative CDK5 regulatory subunit associated protein [Naja naja]|nr:putative CDK5 regulatory subunit associated protein [Naja naja]